MGLKSYSKLDLSTHSKGWAESESFKIFSDHIVEEGLNATKLNFANSRHIDANILPLC